MNWASWGKSWLRAWADSWGPQEAVVETPVEPQHGGVYEQQRANHLRRMQQIDEQDVEDIAMIFSLFRSMSRG